METNQEWNRCLDENGVSLGRCVYDCKDNEDCEDQCLERFKIRQIECPCEVSYIATKPYTALILIFCIVYTV